MAKFSARSMLAAAGAAALATYFFDPDNGRRRRARVRDQVGGRLSGVGDVRRLTALDATNRLSGTLAALRQRLRRETVPDDVLAERVRAKLGRLVSHPGAIEVTASGGVVTLRGPILGHEQRRTLRALRWLPGVRDIADRLEPYKEPGDVSALQGGRPRSERLDFLQERWSPGTRLLAGTGGAYLALRGLARRSVAAPLFIVAGGALLTRAATNMDWRRLLGQRGHAGIDFIKTLYIAAPVERVYDFWANPENFPSFMRNVRSVRRNREDGWHWEVVGPLGASVQWDATITRRVPNELLSWASLPGSRVQHAGTVRFQPEGDGTRVQVEMSYNPPAGAAGHVVASLFGADPRSEMDEDLLRLKTYLETGKASHDTAGAPR